MTTNRTCPQCGAPLPQGMADWLCPKCLLGQAAGPLPSSAVRPPESPDTFPAHTNPSPVLHYFGDYELLEEIARGGMGVVYKARQVSLNRIVAVKLLQFGPLARADFKQRFWREAEAAAGLHHPNIVAIHEVGERDGQPFFSMDYVDGLDLAERVRGQPLPSDRAAHLLESVAKAIHYAHGERIVHRDLKPSNILIDAQDQPRITDFGLAKRLAAACPSNQDPHDGLTVTGQILGTPGFMSPEQALGGRDVTASSDIYSLGALLYFLVTGRAPFAAESVQETLQQVQALEPVAPRVLSPAVPRDLETICLKCLNKEPARRYVSAQGLAEDLRRFLNEEPIEARPVGKREKLWLWCRRKPALAALLLSLAIALVAGGTGILWQWRRAATGYTLLAIALAESEIESDRINASTSLTLGSGAMVHFISKGDGDGTNRMWRSSSGRREIRGVAPNALAVWDPANNRAVLPELKLPGRITHAQFSPDERRIATASSDGTAQIWDAQTGLPIAASLRHAKAINVVRFAPDGSRIATGSSDATACIWDAKTGHRLCGPMKVDDSPTISLRFSRDGRHLITLSARGTVAVWDTRTGQLRSVHARKYSPPIIGLPQGEADIGG